MSYYLKGLPICHDGLDREDDDNVYDRDVQAGILYIPDMILGLLQIEGLRRRHVP